MENDLPRCEQHPGTDPTMTHIRCLKSHIFMTRQRESLLPLKFLLFILKFRGAKGFEETILPPETQRLVIAVRGRVAAHTQTEGKRSLAEQGEATGGVGTAVRKSPVRFPQARAKPGDAFPMDVCAMSSSRGRTGSGPRGAAWQSSHRGPPICEDTRPLCRLGTRADKSHSHNRV